MRAWELGLGAGVALLRDPAVPGERARTVVAAGGLALLVASLSVLERVNYAPLPPATFACLATTALIWAGARDNPVARLVGLKPLVAVGLISYSLYLWHWPVYVIARYYLIRVPTAAEGLALAALAVLLATLSWRYVERPFRGHRIPTRRMLLTVGAAALALCAVAGAIIATEGLPRRFSSAVVAFNRAAGTHYRCPVTDYIPFGGLYACPLALPDGDPASAQVALLGNSHAQMYAPAVEAALRRKGLTGLLVPANGCLPTGEFNLSSECISVMRANIAAVAALPSVRVVIIATTWPGAEEQFVDASGRGVGAVGWPRYLAALDQTIAGLERAGKRVVVVGPIPQPGYNLASIAGRELAFRGRVESPLAQSRGAYDARFGPAEVWLAGLATRVTVVEPSALFCDKARCRYMLEGKPAYSDEGHLAAGVMPLFEPLFAQAIERALADGGER